MTAPRRFDWLATFADPATLSDLFAAARSCMRQICDHEPEDCDCELNRFTPVEFAEFVELTVECERGRPVRFEPAGRPGRREAADRRRLGLDFAAAS